MISFAYLKLTFYISIGLHSLCMSPMNVYTCKSCAADGYFDLINELMLCTFVPPEHAESTITKSSSNSTVSYFPYLVSFLL